MSEKLYYDLHIHSALSPCGDESMTPNNIVNMAAIKELDIIAVTDHNSCGNLAAVISAAKNNELELIVVPGIELETSEEVHVVCLFPELEAALRFEGYVRERLPFVENKPEIFGRQLLMDDEDEITGELPGLLLTASSIDLYEAVKTTAEFGGIAIPAHVDRPSYSVLANLGFISDDLPINLVEISKLNDPEAFMITNKKRFMKDVNFIQSSDAHYLENISERERYLRIEGERNTASVIEALKKR